MLAAIFGRVQEVVAGAACFGGIHRIDDEARIEIIVPAYIQTDSAVF